MPSQDSDSGSNVNQPFRLLTEEESLNEQFEASDKALRLMIEKGAFLVLWRDVTEDFKKQIPAALRHATDLDEMDGRDPPALLCSRKGEYTIVHGCYRLNPKCWDLPKPEGAP